MKLLETFGSQLLDLFGKYSGCNCLAAFQIVLQSVIELHQPIRHRGAAASRHAYNAGEIGARHQTGDKRNVYAARPGAIAETHDRVRIEAELPDRARGPLIDLRLQEIDIVIEGR